MSNIKHFTITGHFGASVVAYFRFVKWLFLLNVFTGLVILGSIVLPQAILDPQTFEEALPANITNSGS